MPKGMIANLLLSRNDSSIAFKLSTVFVINVDYPPSFSFHMYIYPSLPRMQTIERERGNPYIGIYVLDDSAYRQSIRDGSSKVNNFLVTFFSTKSIYEVVGEGSFGSVTNKSLEFNSNERDF